MTRWSTLLFTLLAVAPVAAQGRIELPVSLGELEKRAQADSNDAAAHYNVALGYWNAKRWDDVERELKTAVSLEPRFAAARLALSQLPYARRPKLIEELITVGKAPPKELMPAVEQSDRDFRHAFLIDPMVDLRILAATQRSLDYNDVKAVFGELFANYLQGFTDCAEGRYADCEGRFATLQREWRIATPGVSLPDGVYHYQALAAMQQKNYKLAGDNFRLLMGREEARKQKAEERDMLRIPLRTNEYRYFAATASHMAGNPVDAISLYKEALENDLGLYMAHVRLAQIHEAARNYPDAITERRRAVASNPDDPTLLFDLGVTLGKSGDFAAAETELVKATSAAPRHTEAWFWLGLAREQLGKRAEARAAYERVVALAPSRLASRAAAARQKLATLQ